MSGPKYSTYTPPPRPRPVVQTEGQRALAQVNSLNSELAASNRRLAVAEAAAAASANDLRAVRSAQATIRAEVALQQGLQRELQNRVEAHEARTAEAYEELSSGIRRNRAAIDELDAAFNEHRAEVAHEFQTVHGRVDEVARVAEANRQATEQRLQNQIDGIQEKLAEQDRVAGEQSREAERTLATAEAELREIDAQPDAARLLSDKPGETATLLSRIEKQRKEVATAGAPQGLLATAVDLRTQAVELHQLLLSRRAEVAQFEALVDARVSDVAKEGAAADGPLAKYYERELRQLHEELVELRAEATRVASDCKWSSFEVESQAVHMRVSSTRADLATFAAIAPKVQEDDERRMAGTAEWAKAVVEEFGRPDEISRRHVDPGDKKSAVEIELDYGGGVRRLARWGLGGQVQCVDIEGDAVPQTDPERCSPSRLRDITRLGALAEQVSPRTDVQWTSQGRVEAFAGQAPEQQPIKTFAR